MACDKEGIDSIDRQGEESDIIDWKGSVGMVQEVLSIGIGTWRIMLP